MRASLKPATAVTLRHCARCANRGLLRVQYQSGEPFDVAICDCQAGRLWQARGEADIRARFGLTPDQQVAWVEDFGKPDGESVPAVSESFISAGQTAKRAKL